jgi:hypothetical protein
MRIRQRADGGGHNPSVIIFGMKSTTFQLSLPECRRLRRKLDAGSEPLAARHPGEEWQVEKKVFLTKRTQFPRRRRADFRALRSCAF